MSKLLQFLGRRLLYAVATLWVLSLIVFVMGAMAPGGPVEAKLGQQASQEAVDRLKHQYGLDRPLPEQYARWLGGVVRGNFGESSGTISRSARSCWAVSDHRPVGTDGRRDGRRYWGAVGIDRRAPFGNVDRSGGDVALLDRCVSAGVRDPAAAGAAVFAAIALVSRHLRPRVVAPAAAGVWRWGPVRRRWWRG